jgi:hypothetical protein
MEQSRPYSPSELLPMSDCVSFFRDIRVCPQNAFFFQSVESQNVKQNIDN